MPPINAAQLSNPFGSTAPDSPFLDWTRKQPTPQTDPNKLGGANDTQFLNQPFSGGVVHEVVNEDLGAGAVPFWGDDPDSWDTVTLGGIPLPGIAALGGKGVGYKKDVKFIKGTNGATRTHVGYEPAEIDIKIFLFTAQHLNDFGLAVIKLRPRKDSPQPVDIAHPACALYGISSVLITSLGFPHPMSAEGPNKDIYVVELKAWEWNPSTDVAPVNTPTGSVSSLDNAISPIVNGEQAKRGRPSQQNLGTSGKIGGAG